MKRSLFLVDIQLDFCPGGSLAVPFGDKIVPIVNKLIDSKKFDIIIVSRDWHPADHKSFTSENPGKNVLDVVQVNGKDMIVWPPHCVQNTDGAKFHPDLKLDNVMVFTKGTNPVEHPFSGFGAVNDDGLTVQQYFDKEGVGEVYVVGLAGDFCAKDSALDSSVFYKTFFIVDATRFIGEMTPTLEALAKDGVMIINSNDIDIFMSDDKFHKDEGKFKLSMKDEMVKW